MKGSYGYLQKQTKKAAWITVLLFLMSAIVFLLGIYTKGIQVSGLTPSEALMSNPVTIFRQGNKYNLLTVVAVLGVLPAARYLVNLVLLIKARKTACPEALYEKTEAVRSTVPVLYDLYLTGYQKSYPMYCAYAGHKELLGLTAAGVSDTDGAEAHIREMLARDGQKNVTVKVFSDETKFLERLKGEAARCSADEDAQQASGRDCLRLLLQIAL